MLTSVDIDVYEWFYVWVLVISKLDVCEGECL